MHPKAIHVNGTNRAAVVVVVVTCSFFFLLNLSNDIIILRSVCTALHTVNNATTTTTVRDSKMLLFYQQLQQGRNTWWEARSSLKYPVMFTAATPPRPATGYLYVKTKNEAGIGFWNDHHDSSMMTTYRTRKARLQWALPRPSATTPTQETRDVIDVHALSLYESSTLKKIPADYSRQK